MTLLSADQQLTKHSYYAATTLRGAGIDAGVMGMAHYRLRDML
jgi:hypothetical protein